MTWFKVDDSFHSHPKTEAASLAAVGLWSVAGSWSSKHLTDGVVPDHMIPRLSRGATELAEELVRAGLWRRTKGGYRYHQWSERNPSRDEVTSARSLASSGATLGNHRRWHVAKGIRSDDCALCQDEQGQSTDRGTDRGTDTGPDRGANPPVPSRTSKTNTPLPPKGGDGRGSVDDPAFAEFWTAYPRKVGKPAALKAWRAALKRGAEPAFLVAAAHRFAEVRRGQDPQFTKHPGPWLNDERYNDLPADFGPEPSSGQPAVPRDQQCPEHPWYPRDECIACASLTGEVA